MDITNMRKIVLAKLTQDEVEKIFECERYLSTMITLLQNQFISKNEKETVRASLPLCRQKVTQEYQKIIKKYNLPNITNARYRVDSDTYELYVQVY